MVSAFITATFAAEICVVPTVDQHLSEADREYLVKILDAARELFLTIGVRSATMDDLASHLGISKKTLYCHIDNKADLVSQIVGKELQATQATILQLTGNSKDAIEEMLMIGAMVIESLRRFNANTIYELKKFYPKSWLLVERHHKDFVLNIIKNNLLKGIQEGLYRPEINVDLMSRIYIGKTQSLLELTDSEGKPLPLTEVYTEFFNYHIRGIASPKGVGKLAVYKNKIKLTV